MRAGLSMDQERVRDEAFAKAEQWIKEEHGKGGTDATDREKPKDFWNDYLPKGYQTARIKLRVVSGIAFV
jgi:hypothetical protein